MDHHAYLIKSALSLADIGGGLKNLGSKAVSGLGRVGKGAGEAAERLGWKAPRQWMGTEDVLPDRKQRIREALIGAGIIGGGAAAAGGAAYGAHKLLKSKEEPKSESKSESKSE